MPTAPANDVEFYTGFLPVDPVEEGKLLRVLRDDLGGRYEVGRFLGRGAYATVWHAVDRYTGESVAVKRFEPRTRGGGFYRELSTLFRLQHPRVVRIVNLMESPGGGRYLFLEYCPGGSLRPTISRAGREERPWPAARVAELALQLVEGLAGAHRLGLTHRDLKPENVLFAEPHGGAEWGGTSPVKLADFGLARVLRTDTTGTPASISGSPAYMAPEQFTGRYSPASDLYALGVILYELLTGGLPFEGSPTELARQHLYEPIALGGIPAAWASLLGRLLAKDEAGRPDCATLGEELRQLTGPTESAPGPPAIAFPEPPASTGHARCLGVSAFGLAARQGAGGNWEFAAVSPECVFRFGATRSALRVTPLPGLTAVAGDEVGRLWLVRGNEVWCLPPGEAAAFPWRSFGAPVDVLAACRDRLAVCVGGDLLEFITTDPRRPLWGRPLPGGSAGVLARLPGDRLALGGSEPWPRVLVLAGEGEPAGEVPLPGSCLGLAVAGGAIIARVGRPGGEASAWRADPATGTPERLDASGEVVALAAAPAGEAVFGLCTDGVTHRWAADGPGVTATRFPDGPAWVALAVAGGCFAALGRKGDASWAHARIPADDPTGGMA